MLWVLLDVLIGLLAVVVLVLVGLALYRHGKVLSRAVRASSEQISALSADLTVHRPPSG